MIPETQWREKKDTESSLPDDTNSLSQKHIETLSQICRTHLRYNTAADLSHISVSLLCIFSATVCDVQFFLSAHSRTKGRNSNHWHYYYYYTTLLLSAAVFASHENTLRSRKEWLDAFIMHEGTAKMETRIVMNVKINISDGVQTVSAG